LVFIMTGSVQLYSLLSFLSFYLIYITSKSMFSFFGVILFIASGIALLVYLESSARSKKTDVISILFYIIFTAFFLVLPFINNAISKSGISVNTANLQGFWMPVYILIIFIPVYFLYKNRQHNKAFYIPVVLSAFVPSIIAGLVISLFPEFRNFIINAVSNIIQIGIIDALETLKSTQNIELPEATKDVLSYLSLHKMDVAKQFVYLMPSGLASVFILITYMTDRMKPLIKENALIIREYRIPDYFVWFLIAGGFLILTPYEPLKYVSYNVLIIFGMLYFFQGIQVINKIFERFQVSVFFRMMLLLFIFLYFTFFVAVITLIGLFSIWYKPKWLEKKGDDEKGNIDGSNS